MKKPWWKFKIYLTNRERVLVVSKETICHVLLGKNEIKFLDGPWANLSLRREKEEEKPVPSLYGYLIQHLSPG